MQVRAASLRPHRTQLSLSNYPSNYFLLVAVRWGWFLGSYSTSSMNQMEIGDLLRVLTKVASVFWKPHSHHYPKLSMKRGSP